MSEQQKQPARKKSYWWDWRTLVAVILIAAGIALSVRKRSAEPPGEIEVSFPSYETAMADPSTMEPACKAAGLPVPPVQQVDKEVAVALFAATQQALMHYQDPEAIGRLGMVYHAHDYAEPARVAYARAKSLAPEDYRWTYYHAYTSFELGDSETAIAGFRRTLELKPDYAPCYLNLGKLYHDLGEYDRADEAHEKYVEARPDDPLGYVGLGLTAQARGDHEAVVRHMKKAIGREPVDYRALYALGLAYRELGDEEKARHYLKRSENTPKVMSVNDPLWSEKNAMSVTRAASQQKFIKLMSARRLDEALGLAREMAVEHPDDFGMAVNLAEVCRQKRLFDEAEEAARRAVRLQPESAHGHALLASVLRDAGKIELAREHIDYAVKQDPQFTSAWNVRASVCLAANDVAETVASLRRLFALDPDREEAWSNRLRAHAMRLDRAGDRAGLLSTLEVYLDLNPDDEAVRRKYDALRPASAPATPSSTAEAP